MTLGTSEHTTVCDMDENEWKPVMLCVSPTLQDSVSVILSSVWHNI